MTVRALLVDDEPLARERLRQCLAGHESVAIVAECGDGPSAVSAIRTHRPDLVFLDVRMPDMDGFEVLESLDGNELPLVVFVTAFDDHALRAFDVHAIDYVLKPFDDDRVHDACARAARRLRERTQAERAAELEGLLRERAHPQSASRLIVRSGGRTTFVHFDEIDWIEADGSYVQLHCGAESVLLRETMNHLERQLAPRFVRIHRSTLVQVDRVRELRSRRGGELAVLADGTELRVSPRYQDPLRRALGA